MPGALAAAARLADASGARLAWIPRRAGERGAIEAGAMPGLLPIGRWVGDPKARAEVALAWNKATLPHDPGPVSTAAHARAAAEQASSARWSSPASTPADLPDPAGALRALERTPFIVCLELRASAVTDRADVVFPVAAVAEKAGTFVNWEGRGGTFAAGAQRARRPHRPVRARRDRRRDGRAPGAARRGGRAGRARRPRRLAAAPARPPPAVFSTPASSPLSSASGARRTVRLATWQQLLDAGRMQDGEPYLAGTARPVVARVSAATAAAAGRGDGDKVTVTTAAGSVTVPLEVTDMADGVVWLPDQQPGLRGPRRPRRGPRQQGDPEEGRMSRGRSRRTRR